MPVNFDRKNVDNGLKLPGRLERPREMTLAGLVLRGEPIVGTIRPAVRLPVQGIGSPKNV
jgi:hypothetical protein